MNIVLSRFDKIILAFLGVVVVALGIILWRGDQVGAQITQTFPADGGEIGATGKVGIEFKQAMQQDQVSKLIKVKPEIPGHVVWSGNTLWYVFDAVLQPEIVYSFTLQAGGLAQDGRPILQDHTINFQARSPEVIFLSSRPGQNELWIQAPGGGILRKLTFTGGKVYDYAASPDGDHVVYSVTNSQGGSDLWIIQRDGSQNKLLVDCGADHCSQPAWSPDEAEIVYHRVVSAQNQNDAITGIWNVDPVSGQTDFVISGEQPSWSPDGKWIAVMDPQAGIIRVLNVDQGKGIEVDASSDLAPVWIPKSTNMGYSNLQSAGALSTTALFRVDVTTNQVSRLLENLPSDMELSMPAFTPDGLSYVISMRAFTSDLSKQLWYMPPGGKNLSQITKDQSYSNAHFSWDPWGTELVFQRVGMGVSNASPQAMIWDRQKNALQLLASDAALPSWLP